MARNEDLRAKLCAAGWDLVVFDEDHKLAAHFFGSKLEKTGRFLFAEELGKETRHLLLMTATPHNGKEEDFQLFLTLLDPDRFEGKNRKTADTRGVMRRMIKEDLLTFEGKKLILVDTAGLRRQAKVGESLEYYTALRSRRAAERADVALVVCDAADGVTAQDLRIAELAMKAGCATAIVLNKWDMQEPADGE